MSAFAPQSTIYLTTVDFDSTYKHVRRFGSVEAQNQYFLTNRPCKTYTEYLTVRKNLPDGGFRSSVKVGENIDVLRLWPVNYIFFQNANHSQKWFYAFITDLIYINENTTEIVFETDVFQTWQFDMKIQPSFVAREHSETDEFFENLAPEKFNIQDFHYNNGVTGGVFLKYNDRKWGYLVSATNPRTSSSESKGTTHSGIYQGLYFYFFESVNEVNACLSDFENQGTDAVQSISLIPRFNLGNALVDTDGYVNQSTTAASETKNIVYPVNSDGTAGITFEGFTPKNRKLYSSPFFNLIITNHNGEQAEYSIEDFPHFTDIEFSMKGDISLNPSVTLYPASYKGQLNDYDNGISIPAFPQCSFNSDAYKLWLAKNQFGNTMNGIASAAAIIGGVVTLATGGAALPVTAALSGIGAIGGGTMGVLNSFNQSYQASNLPNRVSGGSAGKTNLLTAIEQNDFCAYWRTIKRHHAEMIDDFFTMYGYQVNMIKTPNLYSRPKFNYVQTVDINIQGGIPADDMEKLRKIFDHGVTLWSYDAEIGDYTGNEV